MKFLKKLFARRKNKLEEVSKRYEDNVTFPEGKKDEQEGTGTVFSQHRTAAAGA